MSSAGLLGAIDQPSAKRDRNQPDRDDPDTPSEDPPVDGEDVHSIPSFSSPTSRLIQHVKPSLNPSALVRHTKGDVYQTGNDNEEAYQGKNNIHSREGTQMGWGQNGVVGERAEVYLDGGTLRERWLPAFCFDHRDVPTLDLIPGDHRATPGTRFRT